MEINKPLSIIVITIIVIIITNIPTQSEKTTHICKNSSNLKLYWEEETLDGTLQHWYEEDNETFKIKFKTSKSFKGAPNIYFLEIYNKTSGIDTHYYKFSDKCIIDIFNTTEHYFDPIKINCIDVEKETIKTEFSNNIFIPPTWCEKRITPDKEIINKTNNLTINKTINKTKLNISTKLSLLEEK